MDKKSPARLQHGKQTTCHCVTTRRQPSKLLPTTGYKTRCKSPPVNIAFQTATFPTEIAGSWWTTCNNKYFYSSVLCPTAKQTSKQFSLLSPALFVRLPAIGEQETQARFFNPGSSTLILDLKIQRRFLQLKLQSNRLRFFQILNKSDHPKSISVHLIGQRYFYCNSGS